MEQVILISVPLDQLQGMISQAVETALDKRQAPAAPAPENEFMTAAQVRDMLKISNFTLYMWRKQGVIPCTRVSRKLLFNKSELLEALKALGKNKYLDRFPGLSSG